VYLEEKGRVCGVSVLVIHGRVQFCFSVSAHSKPKPSCRQQVVWYDRSAGNEVATRQLTFHSNWLSSLKTSCQTHQEKQLRGCKHCWNCASSYMCMYMSWYLNYCATLEIITAPLGRWMRTFRRSFVPSLAQPHANLQIEAPCFCETSVTIPTSRHKVILQN